ncbi:hypothetical protein [Spiroplasma endosymbiont of Danaus chrysippus]|uniref:hypothetical protein n=1 Tax=Spiroplasma endosymbiont of Danaus chrysippus TaxID=2691041 RepID=UPI00157A2826|nr:hypothetical protein [Spiroplasma endosymbiont of Danaus chrysippus]
MPNTENSQSNYTLLKLIRMGISPLSAMIGTSAYYGQLIGNPVLGSINALLFSKKLGIDIWNLNQRPNTKTKLLNSSKKIILGLGTIGLVNYAKFTNADINPNPTESPITTTIDPFPPDLLLSTTNNNDNHLMDWDTFISLNSYGIANLIAGITELIPSKFETIRKIANMATGGCLISSGVAMGINNDFMNAYAVPTIVAGASEIIHNLLPMETTNNVAEMQETTFTNEARRLINSDAISNGSGTSDVLFEQPIYRPTTYDSL